MKTVFDFFDGLPVKRAALSAFVSNLSSENYKTRKHAMLSLFAIFPKLILESFLIPQHKLIPPDHIKPFFDKNISYIDPIILSHLNLIRNNKIKVDLFFDSLLQFSGYQDNIAKLIKSVNIPSIANKFDLLKKEANKNRYRKQIMVALTYDCNLHCSYCFSDTIKNKFQNEISIETFDQILRWCENSGVNIVSFTGGEPTMHSGFDLLLEKLNHNNFECYFATNNTFNRGILDSLKKSNIKLITIHINELDFYSDQELQAFKYNLASLSDSNIPLCFRFNITTKDPTKWDFVFEQAKKNKINQINVALPFPEKGKKNFFIPATELAIYKQTLLDFLLECNRNHIKGYLSKPVPLCIFSYQEIRQLVFLETMVSSCTVYGNSYTGNIVINPDLTIFPCMSLWVESPQKLGDYKDFDSLKNTFRYLITNLAIKPFYEACKTCELFYTFQCQGGCLAYKL